MNPNKKDCNGWFLCPSTRFLGKLYFFNPATGQAVWNLSDMERIMSSRPNFTNSEKWCTYPEPDSPPEDTPTSWGYQPDFRAYQTMHPFGQPPYQNYPSNATEAYPHSMWGMPHPMYMRPGMMNVPQFEPMGQMWPNYGHGPKHFMPENNFYPNPYMHKIPGYSQDMNRYVYGPKPNRNVPVFMGNNLGNKELTKKRKMSMDSVNLKEPLFKRSRSQTDFQSDYVFGPKDSIYPTRSFERFVPEKVCQPCKTSAFAENNSNQNVCKCMRSKSQESLSKMISKSQENLTEIARDPFEFSNVEHTLPNMKLSRSRSMDNLTAISPSEISSNFSLKNSFIFPLRKSSRTKSFDLTSETSSKKHVQSSDAAQSGQETKKTVGENSNNNLSECDLRYILLERRRKSSLSDLHETEKEKAKKVRTSYTKDDMARDCSNKKRVTFDLGVEDSVVDDQDADNPLTDECADATEPCADATEPCADELVPTSYLIPDTDALMKDFETLDELVKIEPSYTLFISSTVRRDIEAASTQSAGGAKGGVARRRVTAARSIARRLAQHTGILVQPLDPPSAVESTSDPLLDCCLQVYEQGYNPILVSDNELLLFKAQDLQIECYQTEDIKQYLDKLKTAVSFNLEKTDEDAAPIVPTAVFKRLVFFPKDKSNQFSLDEEKEKSDTHNNKPDNKKNVKNDPRANQKSFFDKNYDMKETTKKIGNLNLQENIVCIRKNREALASKKQRAEKENANLFNRNDEAAEDNVPAKKKNKSINVYNLDGHLKSFSIKTKEMEEGIRTKMDEYFCCFSQIMETVFLDISKDMPISGCDSTLTPLQSSLHYMREIFADHRTATLLIDKLGAMLNQAHTLINGRLTLSVAPHQFLRMFGCGTLLVSVLKSILPTEGCLEEGARLLLQLERRLEGGVGGESPAPASPAIPAPAREGPKHEHVKKPGEVLQFLTQHHHDWREQARTHTNHELDVNSNVKVVRTTGRDVGLLKLDPNKLITLNDDERSCDDYQEITKDKDKEITNNKAKLIKKLALEALNLPPKMKEIDVGKREKINKECTEMLQQMVTCSVPPKPLTKFYNLRSIIVKDNADSSKKTDLRNRTRSDKQEAQSNNNIDSTTRIVEAKHLIEKSKEQINNNQQWVTREPYDLDAFDYSEMQESDDAHDKDSTGESSSNKNPVESDNSNHVTTTHRSNENAEASPDTGSNNCIYVSNKNSGKINEVDAKNVKDHDVEHSVENYDSGVESEQAHGFVQNFLANLSSTFLTIKQFIESSASELRGKSDARSKNRIQRKAETARVIVARIIDNLDFIRERESNPGSIVAPLLVQGLSENDSTITITKYRLMISKCVVSARVLLDALSMLATLTQPHDSQ